MDIRRPLSTPPERPSHPPADARLRRSSISRPNNAPLGRALADELDLASRTCPITFASGHELGADCYRSLTDRPHIYSRAALVQYLAESGSRRMRHDDDLVFSSPLSRRDMLEDAWALDKEPVAGAQPSGHQTKLHELLQQMAPGYVPAPQSPLYAAPDRPSTPPLPRPINEPPSSPWNALVFISPTYYVANRMARVYLPSMTRRT